MYIERVPNRGSRPAVLLREGWREGKKVRKRTIANLTDWPEAKVEALRAVLRGATQVGEIESAFDVVATRPHGHVVAALGTLKKLGLERIIGQVPSEKRNLVVAMVIARIIEPGSKLATARGLGIESQNSTLGEMLELEDVSEDSLYYAMDWLLERQDSIEKALAKRHLKDGSLVLYDVSSTYFEGRTCPLAKIGHSRDGKRGSLQIVFGLLCNAQGCPVAVEVFEGNTGDPTTLSAQITKVRERFGLRRVVFVGDRGMLTNARIKKELNPVEGLDWISALRAPAIKKLVSSGSLQLSLFDQRDLAEITSPSFPGERLIVCKNPLLAAERKRKRQELIQATEKNLDAIIKATQRKRNPLKGKDEIGLRVGKVVGRFKVAKHFDISITDDGLTYTRDEARINEESAIDGIYVVRTNVPEIELTAERTVSAYKGLSVVERAFRSYKTVDLKVRPIFHRLENRVRAHVFICMLAYYVEWHMRQKLAPILFDDHDTNQARKKRSSVVETAKRSQRALSKIRTKRTEDNLPVHSFQSLMRHLATIAKNRIMPRMPDATPFDKTTSPNTLQQRTFELLEINVAHY